MVINYTDRRDRVFIFSLDEALATDVYERLHYDPKFEDVELVLPGDGGTGLTVDNIAKAARDTISARVLILDVRSNTLTRLQPAYNSIIGFNRGDLNKRCFTVLIGDGPPKLFHAGTSVDVFGSHLARHRLDFDAALFFYDPFLHYARDERLSPGIDRDNTLLEDTPKRLAKGFKQENPLVSDVRRHFRAASLPPEKREMAKQNRQATLAKLYSKRIAEAFPHQKDDLAAWLTKEGYLVPGEALSLHLYPLFFEEWVWDLLWKVK